MGERVMELQDWRAVGASVTGTSHTKTQSPCQDNHLLEIIDSHEQVVVMIASDGAGSASRSEYGSNRACQELSDNIRLFLEEGGVLSDVTRDIVAGWLKNASLAIEEIASQASLLARYWQLLYRRPMQCSCRLVTEQLCSGRAGMMAGV
jgi:serine/threonine protein phosphatase PrpC